jgi:hypothetical protein
MRFRKLRIAFSAVCLIACVLLIVLWVRSYTIRDGAWLPEKNFGLEINSLSGRVVLVIEFASFIGGEQFTSFHEQIDPKRTLLLTHDILGFAWEPCDNALEFGIPFWFVDLTILGIAAAPWIRWSRRFRLRTLLISTTLVAGVLGVAVYVTSKITS